MKRLILILALAALLLCTNPPCQGLKPALSNILRNKHQGVLAGAIISKAFPILIFLNQEGDFTVLWITDSLNACTIATGSDWQFILPPTAPTQEQFPM